MEKHCLSKVSKTDVWSSRFEIWSRRGAATLPATFNSPPLLFLPPFTFDPPFFHCFVLHPRAMLHCTLPRPFCLPSPLFSIHLSPSPGFSAKDKEKNQGTRNRTNSRANSSCRLRVTNLYFPSLSAPCSIFPPSLPTPLRDTLYWFSTATSVKPINISGWGMKSIDNSPPRVAGIFPFFSLLKNDPVYWFIIKKASILCWATHLLLFCRCLCSLMAGTVTHLNIWNQYAAACA